ncbi:MAG: AIR synthase related protein [Nitrososphaerales archaeon]|nr:AIR synthase related protein [Nitrososphaerales archaeon]
MRPLELGKIPIDVLNRTVLHMVGAKSRALLTGPKAGVDFAAIRMRGGFMIVSSDPVTGVSRGIGRYAVTVSSNDVATSGNAPQFMGSVVLLPEGSTEEYLREISTDMHVTAKNLGISIVGGHTEVTPGLKNPIVAATTFSFVKKFVSSEMAREGDLLMMTKTAGLEGTAVLAAEAAKLGKRLPVALVARASALERRLSIAGEAVRAFRTGSVHAMHDCTEGGVLGAAYEMSLASGLGFVMHEAKVPVAGATRQVCETMSVDPLRLIGSGSLLLAVPRGKESTIAKAISPLCRVSTVGEFVKGRRVLVRRSGSEQKILGAPKDELWRALGARS